MADNIKNIGIIHNREFADGVLKLELYNEKDAEQTLQKLHDKFIKQVDELLAIKNKEIMTV